MIRADGLEKRFGERVAVTGVTFEVAPGEIVGLLGPNGGGKTTTMRMLAGLLTPTAGRASIDGRDLASDEAARGLLGFLTEQPGLYERLSATENLRYFASLYEVPAADAGARVAAVLALFGLADRAQESVGGFSKGMRQRLAIARAMLHRPRALLLDEPTSGLDPESAAEVREVILSAAREGVAIVVSTHNLAEAERLCRRVAVVKNRQLAFEVLGADSSSRTTIELAAPMEEVAGLAGLDGLRELVVEGRRLRARTTSKEAIPDLVAALVARGGRILAVVPERPRLEELYLSLVGGAATDAAGAVG
jgi:ABC-2 type transport system ATP-binding protein